MTFAADIAKFEKKYRARAVLLHKKVSLDLFRRVILKTPVDTGRARGNWMLGINVIPQGVSDDAIKNESLRNVITGIRALWFGDTSVLANSVPYIGVLEYGGFPDPPMQGSYVKGKGHVIKSEGGFSKQAPQGMVRIAVEEYRPTLNKALALVKKEIP